MRKKVIGVLLGAMTLVAMAGPASAATNNQRFTIVAKFSGNETTSCRVVASGPIRGAGTCTIEDVSETVTLVHLMLPGGNVDIRAEAVGSTDQFNEAACVFSFTFTETFKIIGGTGAYAGVTGSGTDTGHGVFRAQRTPQGCDDSQASGTVVATIVGHVNLRGSAAA